MCQGGAGVTGGARAAAATGLLVDAVQQQQQCGVLQQNDEGIICQDSQTNVMFFVVWVLG